MPRMKLLKDKAQMMLDYYRPMVENQQLRDQESTATVRHGEADRSGQRKDVWIVPRGPKRDRDRITPTLTPKVEVSEGSRFKGYKSLSRAI